ncbi:hypothetical protein [Mesorhizobium sp. B2-8-5]|uniref:hypothetical protein n=1 Tax=Mesorhizobium sp. B2-8-5 TaxID=2589903 RepID=UPI001D02D937|nr:hypothetical protein [Mesorhizobium sp. B2-8-5]UCI24378.1 hypothetical protein FJ430_22650 [Mesorhizobium sp. B2-8-5]
MEKYVWALVLYYAIVVLGFFAVLISISLLGILSGLLATIGYLTLVVFLNIWRRKRHPRSAYQVELAKRGFGD